VPPGAGPGEPLFERRLLLHRSHTFLASQEHVGAGGKGWDTVKPLLPYFDRLHRVLLIDDDAHKAVVGEEANMVLMPCWDRDDPRDTLLEGLVEVLLSMARQLGGDPDADVRLHTQHATEQLLRRAEEQRRALSEAQHGAAAEVAAVFSQ
jgi:hypothetical protein